MFLHACIQEALGQVFTTKFIPPHFRNTVSSSLTHAQSTSTVKIPLCKKTGDVTEVVMNLVPRVSPNSRMGLWGVGKQVAPNMPDSAKLKAMERHLEILKDEVFQLVGAVGAPIIGINLDGQACLHSVLLAASFPCLEAASHDMDWQGSVPHPRQSQETSASMPGLGRCGGTKGRWKCSHGTPLLRCPSRRRDM